MGQIVDLVERIRTKMNMGHARKRKHPEEAAREYLRQNATVLWDQLDEEGNRKWTQEMPRGKSVYNLTKPMGKQGPTFDTFELLVSKAKIPVWYVFLPLDAHTLLSPDLARLVYAYLDLNPEGRAAVLAMAQALLAAAK